MSSAPAQIAVTGLAVMGRNLARNLARNGFRVAVHNRTKARTDALVKEFGDEGEFVPAADLPALVASLERPRKIIIMVQAGAPTDAVIDDLVPLLDEGDIVVDAGNAHFADTRRRENALKEHGLHFVGTGVSGGEEGALNGPSIMPGGSPESYAALEPMLTKIAFSPGLVMFCTAASNPPVPEDGNTTTSFLVWKAHCRPSRHSLIRAANWGPRWLIMGASMAARTRSGTGVGPGTRSW